MTIQDVLINMANNTALVNAEKNKNKADNTTMDHDSFLQLLMEQMKSQDPTDPTDSSEFITQEALFTQISELQKLNSNISSGFGLMQASSLIGSPVAITDPDDNTKTLTGTVIGATVDSDGTNIVLEDGNVYPVSSVIAVGS